MVRELILQRDLPPNDPVVADFDDATFRLRATGLIARIAELDEADESLGARWFRRLSSRIERALESSDPLVLWRKLATELEGHPGDRTKKRGFGGAADSWALYRAFDKGAAEPDDAPIRGRLLGPLVQWMARRLIRLAPVVVTVYERVKAARGAVDQIDLLLKLRNLLVSNLEVRGYLQSCFDHILVDEFQDTDPLQAEIVLYLCEDAPKASDWRDIEVAPGRLTLVGDPKQSIYRFRRADVAMYDEVRRKVLADGSALEVELVTCFRSTPALIEWGNQRFARLLGTSPDESLFDGESGVVYHRPLSAGRTENVDTVGGSCAVRAICFGGGDKLSAGDARDLEARTLAAELREMVESGGTVVEDPDSGVRRPVSFGDIAVLTIETFSVARLFPAFDTAGIPYASVGGTLFLRDPLHRQFLLALRALADRSDGIALAAILRPPFFAVDPADLLADKAGEESPRAKRARQAKDWIREQRRDRLSRSPGQMARNLLDETGLARTVALGPNGTQRLRRLHELCLVLEQTATSRHLDWDGVTALLRKWVDSPIALDPPLPTDGDAVRVMTIHQAKGLEFPVVALWDSRAPLRARSDSGALRIDRHGRGWQLALKGLTWEEPAGLDLKERELRYRHAERRRLIYVASTRARDLLILPKLRDPPRTGPQCQQSRRRGSDCSSESMRRSRQHSSASDAGRLPGCVIPTRVATPT